MPAGTITNSRNTEVTLGWLLGSGARYVPGVWGAPRPVQARGQGMESGCISAQVTAHLPRCRGRAPLVPAPYEQPSPP